MLWIYTNKFTLFTVKGRQAGRQKKTTTKVIIYRSIFYKSKTLASTRINIYSHKITLSLLIVSFINTSRGTHNIPRQCVLVVFVDLSQLFFIQPNAIHHLGQKYWIKYKVTIIIVVLLTWTKRHIFIIDYYVVANGIPNFVYYLFQLKNLLFVFLLFIFAAQKVTQIEKEIFLPSP